MISPIADFLLFILIRNTYLIEFTLLQKNPKMGQRGFKIMFQVFTIGRKATVKILYLTMNAENNYTKGKLVLNFIFDSIKGA